MPKWTTRDIPNQRGRIAIVTGANSGLGFESALALARKEALVILAVLNPERGQEALVHLKQKVPNAKAEVIQINLARLESVRNFAAEVSSRYDHLDLLLNNAGIMAIPRRETVDGFETQLGVNHLGHFALTGLLLPLLLNTPGSRVVTTSSMMHNFGRVNFEDLQLRQRYDRFVAYSQSKLANLLFAFELQRKLNAAGSNTLSLSAHPGYARTNLQQTSARLSRSVPEEVFYSFANPVMGQSAAMGALPQLYAATAPGIKGGELYGPRFLSRGYPHLARATARAYDAADARRLWQVSEELTGVQFSFEKQPGLVV